MTTPLLPMPPEASHCNRHLCGFLRTRGLGLSHQQGPLSPRWHVDSAGLIQSDGTGARGGHGMRGRARQASRVAPSFRVSSMGDTLS